MEDQTIQTMMVPAALYNQLGPGAEQNTQVAVMRRTIRYFRSATLRIPYGCQIRCKPNASAAD